jgi:hypothetical protein
MILKITFLSIIIIYYLIYSIRYLIQFNRNNYFAGGLKVFHVLMIFLIPFAWIILLKALFKRTPGSYQFADKKSSDSPSESVLEIWMDSSPGGSETHKPESVL